MPENRRTQTRHDVSLPGKLIVGDTTHQVEVLNLSLGGALVTFPDRLGMGTRVSIAFQIPVEDHSIEVGGAIRWSTANEVGVQFDGLRARDVWALNKYFQELTAQ